MEKYYGTFFVVVCVVHAPADQDAGDENRRGKKVIAITFEFERISNWMMIH